jgi:hypothetical protein
MDKTLIIGDTALHFVLRTLILGLCQSGAQIPIITELHVAESIALVSLSLTHLIRYQVFMSAAAHESAL